MKIEEVRRAAAAACREFDVLKLQVFGSAARNSAGPDSDVDLLVEFKDPDRDAGKRFFGLLHRLEDLLGCEIDLLTAGSLRNPYFRRRVLQESVPVAEVIHPEVIAVQYQLIYIQDFRRLFLGLSFRIPRKF